MPMNPIDAPIALDLRLRESAGGAAKPKKNSVPAPAAPPPDVPEHEAAPVDNSPPPAAGPNLKFSTDEATGKSVVALIDPVDGRVLRQMPSEEAIKVAEAIGRFQGMFVDLKV